MNQAAAWGIDQMLVSEKINPSPKHRKWHCSKDKAIGTPPPKVEQEAPGSARNFPDLQTYRLESLHPQVQGHCFIHFAFSSFKDMIKQVNNENIPFFLEIF